jgi:hypothetical protein
VKFRFIDNIKLDIYKTIIVVVSLGLIVANGNGGEHTPRQVKQALNFLECVRSKGLPDNISDADIPSGFDNKSKFLDCLEAIASGEKDGVIEEYKKFITKNGFVDYGSNIEAIKNT